SEDDDDDEDDVDHKEMHVDTKEMAALSRPNLATIGHSTNAWTAAATSSTQQNGGSSHRAATTLVEKDALRLHLNSGIGAKNTDLESNPDTIISLGDGASMSDIDYSDKAAIVQPHTLHTNTGAIYSDANGFSVSVGEEMNEYGRAVGSGNDMDIATDKADYHGAAVDGATTSKFTGLLRVFGRGNSTTLGPADGARHNDSTYIKPSNTATLAVGGAAIGNLPERRNSRGEDIMVISRIPPFTPVRYTILSTLMQTPAGFTRQGNLNTFKTLPFALRGDYYGFYSTFIADGATLQINVEGKISEAITRQIHSQQYTVDMMDEAHSEVLQLLYDNIFKKFVRLYHRDMTSIM
ncbi:hypothetical protein GGI05_002888, partial [Coemansia sp. RSA 2603]